jgi:hypothetical protein
MKRKRVERGINRQENGTLGVYLLGASARSARKQKFGQKFR